MKRRALSRLAIGIASLGAAPAFGPPALTAAPQGPETGLVFTAETIETGIRGGYQVVVADLNLDARPDLIVVALALPELLWFENRAGAGASGGGAASPIEWRRHVIASGFSGMINVAANDLDGDGIPELALAHGFTTSPASSEGIVTLLTHTGDPTGPWATREIDRVPTSHRLRWIDADGSGRKLLVNSPLAGANTLPPEYRGSTPIFVYDPADWVRRALTEADGGVVHAVEPVPWTGVPGEVLLSASFLGVHLHRLEGGSWSREQLAGGRDSTWLESGSSEAATGTLGGEAFLATIEHWHGNQVVVYRREAGEWGRHVIDSSIDEGHSLVSADFDGDGDDELVAGARRGRQVVLYDGVPGTAWRWTPTVIDDGETAASGCAAADFDGDGPIDLVCVGSATANLRWYRNGGGG